LRRIGSIVAVGGGSVWPWGRFPICRQRQTNRQVENLPHENAIKLIHDRTVQVVDNGYQPLLMSKVVTNFVQTDDWPCGTPWTAVTRSSDQCANSLARTGLSSVRSRREGGLSGLVVELRPVSGRLDSSITGTISPLRRHFCRRPGRDAPDGRCGLRSTERTTV